jgi:flagellar hook-basal body complex protein FliE
MPTPITGYATALNAYGEAAAKATAAKPSTTPTGATPRASFAETLTEMLEAARAQGKASENGALAAVAQRQDLQSVVTAVAEADVALQSVIAIRDRAIEAYKDIMRMPI